MAKQKTKYKTTFRYNLRWRKLAKMAMDAYGDEAFYGYGYVSVEARRSLIEPLEHAGFSVPRSWYGTGYINKQDRKYVYEKLRYIMTARKPKPEGPDDPLAQGMKIWEKMHDMIDDNIKGVNASTETEAYVMRLYAMNVLEALNQIVPLAGGRDGFMYALGLMNKKTEGEFWDDTQEALAYKGYDLHESSMMAWTALLLAVIENADINIPEDQEDEVFDTLDKLSKFNYDEAKKNRAFASKSEKAALEAEDAEQASAPAAVQNDETIKTADGASKDVTKSVEDPENETDTLPKKPTKTKKKVYDTEEAKAATIALVYLGEWNNAYTGKPNEAIKKAKSVVGARSKAQLQFALNTKVSAGFKEMFKKFVYDNTGYKLK